MDLIEGEWNGFVFSRATEAEIDEIGEIVTEHYFTGEPMTLLLGYSQEYDDDFRKIWTYFLKDNLTFFARDIETKKMAGLRVIFDHNKGIDWAKFNFTAPQTSKLLACVKVIDEQSNLVEKYNLDTYADLLFTVVHKDFRGRGLATEMYRRAITLARARGYFLAKALFSSPISRAGAARAGFTQTASITIADTKDENGQPISENATDESVTQGIYLLKE